MNDLHRQPLSSAASTCRKNMDKAVPVDPRPTFSLQQATKLISQHYGMTVAEISALPSYMDQNFFLMDVDGCKYVLKIINSEESKNTDLLGLQASIISFLLSYGVPAPTTIPNTSGQLMTLEVQDCEHGAQIYCMMLMTYLPGKTIAQSQVTTQDLYQVGKLAATIDVKLKQFVSPKLDVLERGDSPWSLPNFPQVESCLSVMDGDPLQDVVKAVIEQFKSQIQPKISSFRKGLIHGDLSDVNILVTPVDDGRHKLSGVLDFGLLMNGFNVHELAITILYLMLENPSPLDVGGAVLAGWESIMPLNNDEKDSLFLLVLSRLCQSLVYGRHNARKYPENKEYLLSTAKNGTGLLKKLWEMGKKEVEKKWFTDASTFSVSQK